MNFKYIAGALGFSAALTGCSLDVKMYDGVMAEDISSENIADLSFGSYRHLKGSGPIFYGYSFRELGSDDISWGGTSTGSRFKIYDYRRDIASTQTEYAWELGYRAIGNNNLVIEMVEALGDNATREHILIKGAQLIAAPLSDILIEYPASLGPLFCLPCGFLYRALIAGEGREGGELGRPGR